MRPSSILYTNHHRRLHRTVPYYLTLNYAIKLMFTVNNILATTSPTNSKAAQDHHLEFAKKLLSSGKYSDAKNYASAECAKVVEYNPEAKKPSYILNEMTDEYMLNPCKTKIWFVIELCEAIEATHIEIANYELFSSTPKDFTVYFSDIYPALDWKLVGKFTANDSRTLQAFDLNQVGFGKFIRVELHSHYGNEHYCPISQVRVFGASMVDDYTKSEQQERLKNEIKKYEPKTSAYQIYFNMMIEPYVCGLSRSTDLIHHKNSLNSDINDLTLFHHKDSAKRIDTSNKPVVNTNPNTYNPTLPTAQPQMQVNRTAPLKPSIFVDLSNKVKALETLFQDLSNKMKAMEVSLKVRIEENDKKTDSRFDKLTLEVRSFSLIGLACLVYIVMMELM